MKPKISLQITATVYLDYNDEEDLHKLLSTYKTDVTDLLQTHPTNTIVGTIDYMIGKRIIRK